LVERRIGFIDRQLDEDQPAERLTGAYAVRTLPPRTSVASWISSRAAAASSVFAARAACTWARLDMSVLRKTRLMSGWATSLPCALIT